MYKNKSPSKIQTMSLYEKRLKNYSEAIVYETSVLQVQGNKY